MSVEMSGSFVGLCSNVMLVCRPQVNMSCSIVRMTISEFLMSVLEFGKNGIVVLSMGPILAPCQPETRTAML